MRNGETPRQRYPIGIKENTLLVQHWFTPGVQDQGNSKAK